MSWFLDQFVYGSGKLDYAIGELKNQRKRNPKGWINEQYSERKNQSGEEPVYQTEVLVRRLGEIKIPVDVLVIFEDGSETREQWDGQYRWKRFRYEGPVKAKSAIVDPNYKLVIDINRTNNTKTVKSNRLAPWKWVSNWVLWLQHAMEVFTIFGS
jgi:hypothetical protein